MGKASVYDTYDCLVPKQEERTRGQAGKQPWAAASSSEHSAGRLVGADPTTSCFMLVSEL